MNNKNSYTAFDIMNIGLRDDLSLIEASAGTGKTFSIANIFLRLVLEKNLQPRNILVVTFTKAAADELKSRIRAILVEAQNCIESSVNDGKKSLVSDMIDKAAAAVPGGREKLLTMLHSAIIHFDEAEIFTIHSFCRGIIQENAFESGCLFNPELLDAQEEIIEEAVRDFWRAKVVFGAPFYSTLVQSWGITRKVLKSFAQTLVNRQFSAHFLPEKIFFDMESMKSDSSGLSEIWKKEKENIKALIMTEVEARRMSAKAKELFDNEHFIYKLPSVNDMKFIKDMTPFELEKFMLKVRKEERNYPVPEHDFFRKCDDFTKNRSAFVPVFLFEFMDYFINRLKTEKEARNQISFDDIIMKLRDALKSPSAKALVNSVKKKTKAVLIDEFQDTDPIQYEVFRRLFIENGTNVFLIGDPKQSIYDFRGADVFAYMKAAEEAPCRYTLSTNWRSSDAAVNAVNKLFSNITSPFPLGHDESIPFRPVLSSPESKGNRNRLRIDGEDDAGIVFFESSYDNKSNATADAVSYTVWEILRLLRLAALNKAFIGERPLKVSDIAILTSSHGESRAIKAELEKHGLSAVIQKSASVFQAPEAVALGRVISAIENPSRNGLLNAALCSSLIGMNGIEICRLLEAEDDEAVKYDSHLQKFSHYKELWTQYNFMVMFRRFMLDYSVKDRLMRDYDGERKLTDLLHLAELLQNFETENGSIGISSTVAWYMEKCAADNEEGDVSWKASGGVKNCSEEYEQRLEKDEESLQIMTVFKSKGLEFPLVFCPFMWSRPVLASKGKSDIENINDIYHINSKIYLSLIPASAEEPLDFNKRIKSMSIEKLSSLMRLFYVSATRASNRTYIAYGRIGRDSNIMDYIFTFNPESDLVEGLELCKEYPPQTMTEALKKRFEDKNIRLDSRLKEGLLPELPEIKKENPFLTVREFNGSLNSSKRIASFSLLIRDAEHAHDGAAGTDELPGLSAKPEVSPFNNAESFFDFPAGPNPGTCIHSIIEETDFKTVADCLKIENNLRFYGIRDKNGDDIYSRLVADMLGKLLAAPFCDGTGMFRLSDINAAERLNELEFHHPVGEISPDALAGVFGISGREHFAEALKRLKFTVSGGYMHGYMDMVFSYNGRYYIIDWKSNKLGDSYSDYSQDALKLSMEESFYILQYYIYTLALDKHLKNTLPGYDYERDFGGVFYVYLRGVTPDIPGNGIYYDKVPFETLKIFDGTISPLQR